MVRRPSGSWPYARPKRSADTIAVFLSLSWAHIRRIRPFKRSVHHSRRRTRNRSLSYTLSMQHTHRRIRSSTTPTSHSFTPINHLWPAVLSRELEKTAFSNGKRRQTEQFSESHTTLLRSNTLSSRNPLKSNVPSNTRSSSILLVLCLFKAS